MKRNTILKALMAAVFSTAALQVQAQGIYVNKKNGESIPYPAATFDKVTPTSKATASTNTTEGVVATLKCEKIADMINGRFDHHIFASGNDIVVVGGLSSWFKANRTAEVYHNGVWKEMSIDDPHRGGFSAILADGRVMIGGGGQYSGSDKTASTIIYNPSTQTFTSGPDMTTPRSECQAVPVGNTIYVTGNYKGDDKTMDYFDGTSFKAVGDTYERSYPYIFASEEGDIWTWGTKDTEGNPVELYQTDDGRQGLLVNGYNPSTNETGSYFFSILAEYKPIVKRGYLRPTDYYSSASEEPGYFFIGENSEGEYKLFNAVPSGGHCQLNSFGLDFPKVFPGTDVKLLFSGAVVLVNSVKHELYIITQYESHDECIISYDYYTGDWSIAKTEGLHQLQSWSGAFALLNDGRIVCAGGINGDDGVKDVYIITPPTAGTTGIAGENGVDVWKKDGSHDTYWESELESISTYE